MKWSGLQISMEQRCFRLKVMFILMQSFQWEDSLSFNLLLLKEQVNILCYLTLSIFFGYYMFLSSGIGSFNWREVDGVIPFEIVDKAVENPDFYNCNRVKVRYCDGGSFSGDSENKAAKLQFRGKRIWLAATEELMAKGMRQAKQALLSGCSAGGLAAILRCDDFGNMFYPSTRVKCLSDAGFFLDALWEPKFALSISV
ncbi:BnaA03g59580D [Brassica napus]|uniref:Pectin acetylesterase n=2 Tax=Brassica TaxID=3705 RepID=A0A078J1S9_BRANA|nr:BnaA03g59580D [Brassica napus]VDC84463.1 unnamed protein product [Brassica rapa]